MSILRKMLEGARIGAEFSRTGSLNEIASSTAETLKYAKKESDRADYVENNMEIEPAGPCFWAPMYGDDYANVEKLRAREITGDIFEELMALRGEVRKAIAIFGEAIVVEHLPRLRDGSIGGHPSIVRDAIHSLYVCAKHNI